MNAVATTSEEIGFIDRVLESWAAWSRSDGAPVVSHSSARYSSGHDVLRSYLPMTDSDFARVDAAVAHLDAAGRFIIRTHYRSDESVPKGRKALRMGITIRQYNVALVQAQSDVHCFLRPDVYDWQLRV